VRQRGVKRVHVEDTDRMPYESTWSGTTRRALTCRWIETRRSRDGWRGKEVRSSLGPCRAACTIGTSGLHDDPGHNEAGRRCPRHVSHALTGRRKSDMLLRPAGLTWCRR
jgi:hypothetical protein